MPPDTATEAAQKRVVTLTISLTEENLGYMWADIIGAVSYWAMPVYVGPRTITVKEHDPISTATPQHRLDAKSWFGKGMQVLADRGYYRLGELMKGDYDKESLDCLVQAAIFGDIPYG